MYHAILNESKISGKNAQTIENIKKIFNDAGKQITFHNTTHKGHATEIAKQLSSQGEECTLIAMGGDGTLHEVLNGIADFEKTALALIPFGTGNDFAQSIKLTENVEQAAKIIANGTPSYIDFIQLSSGLKSINSVGTGIDVDILKRTYAGNNNSKFKYIFSLLATLFKFKSYKFKITYEDGCVEEHSGFIAVCGNGKQFGGGIRICPDAVCDDGLIDFIVVDYISKIQLIGALIKLLNGKINKVKQAKVLRCKSIKIETIPINTIEAEGELYDNMQIDAKIVHGVLKFYMP